MSSFSLSLLDTGEVVETYLVLTTTARRGHWVLTLATQGARGRCKVGKLRKIQTPISLCLHFNTNNKHNLWPSQDFNITENYPLYEIYFIIIIIIT